MPSCPSAGSSRKRPGPFPARPAGGAAVAGGSRIGILFLAVLGVTLGGCAALSSSGDEREEAAVINDEHPEVAEPHPAIAGGQAEVALADPLPKPRTVDELLDMWSARPEAPADEDLWARIRKGFRLNAADNDRVDDEIRWFNARQKYFDMLAERGQPYLYHIVEAIEERGLPAELVLVPVVESGFQPFAYSHGRAEGIWQFVPGTARRFGLRRDWWYDGRRDPLASTEAALDYLEYLHDYFDGDWLLALAAYNAGEGRVQRARRANAARNQPTDFWHLNLPAETEQYVPRILALREVFARPDEYGVSLREIPDEPAIAVVELDGQIDLALAAEMAGIDVEEIYRHNPGFNRWATRPDGPHRLAIPKSSAPDLREALDERDAAELVEWRRHRIASGDTLSGIAGKYATSVDVLREVNGISGSTIRAGDHLLVPTASHPEGAYALSEANRRRATQSRGRAGRQRIDYEVARGDTLWDVARSHEVSVRKLARWNDMAPDDTLRPGRRLAIWVDSRAGGPNAAAEHRQLVRYRVRAGDSLSAIAARFSVAVHDIRRWNDLERGAYIQPGQELELHVDVTAQADAS